MPPKPISIAKPKNTVDQAQEIIKRRQNRRVGYTSKY
jgi:hypothetical protein